MATSTYKYARILALIANCPPVPLNKYNGSACRFVFEDISEEKSFVPQFIANPKRFNEADDAKRCANCSLSMFTNEEAALQRYHSLLRTLKQRFYSNIGTHIAKGDLTENEGDITPIEKSGHFNIYLFDGVNVSNKFALNQKLQ